MKNNGTVTQHISRRRPHSGIRLPLWSLVLLISLLLLLLAGSAVWLFRTVQQAAAEWQATAPDFGNVSQPVAPGGAQPFVLTVQPTAAVRPIFSPDALKPWSGRDRVTILLLGIDQRCDEEGPTRTDSIMLLTVDPIGLSGAALSVPRDLWVEIPGFGVDRVNQAHYLGEVYDYPGGGPALAVDTIEGTIGVKVNYYVTVNFDAFVKIIDLIDGIELDVPEEIDDPLYPDQCYGYEPFYIGAGKQQLDGYLALKYARTRVTFGGDVDRAGRQQEVALAVREKIMRINMVPQLIARAPELWYTLQDNVQTDLSIDEALQLALLLQDIPRSSIRTAVVDYNYVYNETTPSGQLVLVPIRENIRELRHELFAPPAIPTPVIENLAEMVARENARVAIYNGTAVFGLAGATQSYLLSRSINVTEVGNADSAAYRSTQIIDYGSHRNTALYLAQLLAVPPLNVSNGTNPDGAYDLLVILGSDWQLPDP
jgi:polyisoprenyl-teichoic acid--peptidoglycan teichoic acid transferase